MGVCVLPLLQCYLAFAFLPREHLLLHRGAAAHVGRRGTAARRAPTWVHPANSTYVLQSFAAFPIQGAPCFLAETGRQQLLAPPALANCPPPPGDPRGVFFSTWGPRLRSVATCSEVLHRKVNSSGESWRLTRSVRRWQLRARQGRWPPKGAGFEMDELKIHRPTPASTAQLRQRSSFRTWS